MTSACEATTRALPGAAVIELSGEVDGSAAPVLTDAYVPSNYWSSHQRLHQYSGPHDEKWGGATLNIDSDAADGRVAGTLDAPSAAEVAERLARLGG